tara:strand:- start:466 stop:816 length:351 start_codon:yes stop_codon:yes gene_type:complete
MKYYVASMSYSEVDSIKEFESIESARSRYNFVSNSNNTSSASLCEKIALKDIVEGQWTLLLCKSFIPEFGITRNFYQACDGSYTQNELTEQYKELKAKTSDKEVIVSKVLNSTDYF